MGAKLRARLPEGNGLTAELADELAVAPRQVVAVVLLGVDQVVTHVTEDTRTTVLEMVALEVFDGDQGDELQRMLNRRHEDRTGEVQIPYDDVAGASTGDQAEYARQAGLLRQERAAQLREAAEGEADRGKADTLELLADRVEGGLTEPDADEVAQALPGGLVFSDGEPARRLQPQP